ESHFDRCCAARTGLSGSLAMKKLLIAFVMATFVASPAFAQKRHAISPEAAAAQAYAPSDPGALTVDPYTPVRPTARLSRSRHTQHLPPPLCFWFPFSFFLLSFL